MDKRQWIMMVSGVAILLLAVLGITYFLKIGGDTAQSSFFKTAEVESSEMGTTFQYFVNLEDDETFELYLQAYGGNKNIKQKVNGTYEVDGKSIELHFETIEEKVYDNLDRYKKNIVSDISRVSVHDDPPTFTHPISYQLLYDEDQMFIIRDNKLIEMEPTEKLPEWEEEIELVDYSDLKKEDRERITIRLVFERFDPADIETFAEPTHHSPVNAHLQIVNNSDYHIRIKPSQVSLAGIDEHIFINGNYDNSDYVLTVPKGETEMIEDIYTDEQFDFFSRMELIYVLNSDGTSGGANYDSLGEQVTDPVFRE